MAVDVDRILRLLDQDYINREVLLKHDEARESFRLPKLVAEDAQDFKTLVTSYVQHHHRTVEGSAPSDAKATGEAKRILDSQFQDRYQEGYSAALGMGISGSQGGMRAVLNAIADALKSHALGDYMDHVFLEHINPLSKEENEELSKAFYERFAPIFRQFTNLKVDEYTWARNTRAALDYHREAIEKIKGIARKI